MSILPEVDRARLVALCRREHIARLGAFGSVARGDSAPDSDLDLLVEFQPGTRLGLRFFRIQDELSELFGRKVDLNTRGFLGRIADTVQKDVVPLYEAA